MRNLLHDGRGLFVDFDATITMASPATGEVEETYRRALNHSEFLEESDHFRVIGNPSCFPPDGEVIISKATLAALHLLGKMGPVIAMSQRCGYEDGDSATFLKTAMYNVFDRLLGNDRSILTQAVGDAIATNTHIKLRANHKKQTGKEDFLKEACERYDKLEGIESKNFTLIDDEQRYLDEARSLDCRAVNAHQMGSENTPLVFCQLLIERIVDQNPAAVNLKILFQIIDNEEINLPCDTACSSLKLGILKAITAGIPENSTLTREERKALECSAVELLRSTPGPTLFGTAVNSNSIFKGLGDVRPQVHSMLGKLLRRSEESEARSEHAINSSNQLLTLSRLSRYLGGDDHHSALAAKAADIVAIIGDTFKFQEEYFKFLTTVRKEVPAAMEYLRKMEAENNAAPIRSFAP